MSEYTPNSHKFREEKKGVNEERKKVEKVVTGTVKTKKKSEIRKAAEGFLGEDASSVKSYILYDVFIPGAKRLISEVIKNAVDTIFGTGRSDRRDSSTSRVSYRKYYDDPRDDRRPSVSSRDRFDFDDIVFESRGEAQIVLEEMDNMIRRYGYARVADMYDLVGLPHPYTSVNYGWTSLRNAYVDRVRDGYIIKLPRIMTIE